MRKKVAGTAERPRLAVFRSNRHIYAQLIDDDAAGTLVAASDRDVEAGRRGPDGARAKAVGELLAARAKAAGIERVVFDRGGRLTTGACRARRRCEGGRLQI